ncbi:hypothetical protein K435DRAFT_363529 [Dendrothele bispora CBS 962.96]|uniref:Uncharacterized protein n=1 Tax=Dendrothele bispora (strain CBS 962.96) TaxID=1314807 RepID=A0A4S8LCC0_DENBC|nr:hypothetical protein K435DRAFT_363529 [Dendrothele bispora CBS 962.96]
MVHRVIIIHSRGIPSIRFQRNSLFLFLVFLNLTDSHIRLVAIKRNAFFFAGCFFFPPFFHFRHLSALFIRVLKCDIIWAEYFFFCSIVSYFATVSFFSFFTLIQLVPTYRYIS